METSQHELLVIGAGPGGYVAALRAAQLGLDVACVEREPALGGTCLRVGCIPSKALLSSSALYERVSGGLGEHGIAATGVSLDLAAMMRRKDEAVKLLTDGIAQLFKRRGVTRYEGTARFLAPGRVAVSGAGGEHEISAKHVIIATGGRTAALPGIEPDGELVCTSTEALSWPKVPGELIVIGAGAIGLELGTVWRRLGAKVTVLEVLKRILPGMDAEIAREAQRLLKRQGIVFKLGVSVEGVRAERGRALVQLAGGDQLAADRVLLAAGRVPCTDNLDLEALGIEMDERGFIPVDQHYRCAAENTYAIGDVIAGPMLAHRAEEEGIACVEMIAGGEAGVDHDLIPGVVYTEPEVAGVGRTEEALTEAGIPHRKGVFHFRANSRARAAGHIDGRVKVLAHAETDELLGVHAVGPQVSELIAEAAVALSRGMTSAELGAVCHAHPTLAEALKEAALALHGRAIHA